MILNLLELLSNILEPLADLVGGWPWFSFEKKPKTYAYGTFYKSSDYFQAHWDPDPEMHMTYGLPFEVLEGKFEGVIFSFLTLTAKPDKLSFDFVIHKAPKWVTNLKFAETAQGILLDILTTAEKNNQLYGTGLIKTNETRNDYLEEPIDESRIHHKSDAVHKE